MAKYNTSSESPINLNDISRLSAGSKLKGNFYSEKDIRVDGLFEGDIITKGKTVVGESAVVKGNIVCAKADVWGKIEGKIFVKDRRNRRGVPFLAPASRNRCRDHRHLPENHRHRI